MSCATTEPFVRGARVETMLRDFNRLRAAIRNWNPEETEKSFGLCERWIQCINPSAIADKDAVIDNMHRVCAAHTKSSNDFFHEVVRLRALRTWTYDTLEELNESNYDHGDVCRANAAVIEVIRAIAPFTGDLIKEVVG
jgi:hypothetical protein